MTADIDFKALKNSNADFKKIAWKRESRIDFRVNLNHVSPWLCLINQSNWILGIKAKELSFPVIQHFCTKVCQ